MALQLNDNLQILSPKSLDNRYGKIVSGSTIPYSSISEVNSTISSAYRFKGLTVAITSGSTYDEYWYKDGITDNDLVMKIPNLLQYTTTSSFNTFTASVIRDSASFDSDINVIGGRSATLLGIFGNSSDITTPLSAALANPGVKEIIFDNVSGSGYLFNGAVSGSGKTLTFLVGNRLSGSGTLHNIVINAEESNHIFDTGITLHGCKSADGEFSAKWFGALANGSDDTVKLQRAIDTAITNKISVLRFPYGTYTITKGLLFRQDRTGDNIADFIGLRVTGRAKSYAIAQTQGSEVVISCNHTDNFAIGVQKGKGMIFENIGLFGKNVINYNPSQVVNNATSWSVNGCRDVNVSPYAGFVIDPFGNGTIATSSRYPGFEDFYNEGNAGSTDITFKDCKLKYFIVGYCISPNSTSQNAEIIKIIDCWGDSCKSAISTGNTQTRTVYVEHFSSWGSTETIIDCERYAGTGVAPEVRGTNLAGGTKYFVRMSSTGVPYGRFDNIYGESIYSLGGNISAVSPTGDVGFSNCYFNFLGGESGTGVASCMVRASSVQFENCFISYYSQGVAVPFNIDVFKANLVNCNVYGLMFNVRTTANDINNTIEYTNISGLGNAYNLSTRGRLDIGASSLGTTPVPILRDMVWNLETTAPNHDRKFKTGNLKLQFTLSSQISASSIISDTDWTFYAGDDVNRIIPGDFISLGGFTFNNGVSTGNAMSGMITTVNQTTKLVTVKGKLYEMTGSTLYTANIWSYSSFLKTHYGDITNGSTLITNVFGEANDSSSIYVAGQRITHPAIPAGAYIKEVSGSNTILSMSLAATATETRAAIPMADYTAEFRGNYSDISTAQRIGFKKGDIIWNNFQNTNASGSNVVYWLCTGNGVFGTDKLPTFRTMTTASVV